MNVLVTVIVVASALKLAGNIEMRKMESSDAKSRVLVFVGYHLSFSAVNV